MVRLEYTSLVTKETINYYLSIINDEQEKKDFMNVLSKIDIKIDTKPVIEGNEICYNMLIRERNTKRGKHFQICRLEFRKGEKMGTIPNLIDILNELYHLAYVS